MSVNADDRKEFNEIITEKLEAQQKWFEATFKPLIDTLARHEKHIEEVPLLKDKLDNHIKDHETSKNDNKFTIEMWIIIGIFIANGLIYKFL